jgi:hypothetical protein
MTLAQTLTQKSVHVLRPMSIAAGKGPKALRRGVLKARLLAVAVPVRIVFAEPFSGG